MIGFTSLWPFSFFFFLFLTHQLSNLSLFNLWFMLPTLNYKRVRYGFWMYLIDFEIFENSFTKFKSSKALSQLKSNFFVNSRVLSDARSVIIKIINREAWFGMWSYDLISTHTHTYLCIHIYVYIRIIIMSWHII